MTTGRNEPCPCGSGRKYKKCCELLNETVVAPAVARATAAHDVESVLVERMLRFSRLKAGAGWMSPALELYAGDARDEISDVELQLAVPWALYNSEAGGRATGGHSIAQLFREASTPRLPVDLLEMLDAQLGAWLAVLDVLRVERGVGVAVRDLLTGIERFVNEISASRTLSPGHVILGRIVDIGEVSIFGGLHPSVLALHDADVIVQAIRRLCRVRTRPVAPAKLQLAEVELALIHAWRGAVARYDARPAPQIENTDGDPLLFTTDHFDFRTQDTGKLLERLHTFPGVELPDVVGDESDETIFTITRPGNATHKSWDNTIIGSVRVKRDRMRVESNSTRRADTLRSALTEHLGQLARYRVREETSQQEIMRKASGSKSAEPSKAPDSQEVIAIIKAFKERYMLGWLDESIPALGGLTPREAAKSPRSKKALELLLREMESSEGQMPEAERFDINRLREALGVEERG